MHSTGWLDLKYTHNLLFGEKKTNIFSLFTRNIHREHLGKHLNEV